jgi:hypothetical protein
MLEYVRTTYRGRGKWECDCGAPTTLCRRREAPGMLHFCRRDRRRDSSSRLLSDVSQYN